MADGYVYILSHTSGTTVKVGETTVSPQNRLRDYSKTYELKGFHFHKSYRVPAESRREIERLAHQTLREYRLSAIGGAREIFSCSADVAEKAVVKAIAQSEAVQKAVEESRKVDKKVRRQKEIEEDARKAFERTDGHEAFKALDYEISILEKDVSRLKIRTTGMHTSILARLLPFGLSVPSILIIVGVLIGDGSGNVNPVVALVFSVFGILFSFGFAWVISDGKLGLYFNEKGYIKEAKLELANIQKKIGQIEKQKEKILSAFLESWAVENRTDR